MNPFIIYKGVKYYGQYKEREKGNYYKSYRNPETPEIEHILHRRIWQEAHGNIPKGMLIHHINENPEDNRIENLALMSRSVHQSMHVRKRFENPEYRKKNKDFLLQTLKSENCKNGFQKWLKSDSAKDLWKEMKKTAWANIPKHTCICKRCGKSFEAFKPRKPFCREACRTAFQRKDKFTDKRLCKVCGNEFLAHKWQHVIHCTRKCAAVSMMKNRPPRQGKWYPRKTKPL